MSYRPVSEARRKDLNERIVSLKERVVLIQGSIVALEQELEQGEWVCDLDYSKLPMPEPHCYICKRSTSIDTCSRGYTYGVVCEHYRHFAEEGE